MSTAEAGESLRTLDSLATKLLKAWWRCEAFLERWKRAMAQESESYDPRWPPDAPMIRRRRTPPQQNSLAVVLAAVGLITQVGMWVWWGGRLSQRVDNLESVIREVRQENAGLAADNGRQNITLGIIGNQYGEISRRLENIEKKMDRR